MPNKRTKVFLSSTAADLIDYRTAAREAIRRADEFECVCMEDFGAQPDPPLDVCLSRVNECEVFVGIVGWRYGSCPPGERNSYSEFEYNFAREWLDMDCLIYMADETFKTEAQFSESDEDHKRLKHLRKRIKEHHVISKLGSPDQFATELITDLYNHLGKAGVSRYARN